MEIAGFVVAVLAAVAAVAAALYAGGANRRADEANRTAERALDLQARIDAREREYRDVEWSAESDEKHGFTLENTGLTNATQVTLVLRGFQGAERHDVGDIPSRGKVTVQSTAAAAWMSENKDVLPLSPPFFVHWSSPLGVAEQQSVRAQTLFISPDEVED